MSTWSLERAQAHLLSLELFGMRMGLERMHRLLAELGSPQRRLRSIHVVGTNGKSSTVRMAAAILHAHGVRTGAYVSPHLASFAERVRVDGEDLPPDAFAAAIGRAAEAADAIEDELEPGDRITQFELLTAAALSELARLEVDAAVIEAGLGGRLDATNVLDAPVVALTSVGLEHTEWLGSTQADIAREKLAVLSERGTLVVGELEPEALREAEVAAERRNARLVRASDREAPGAGDGGARTGDPVLRGYQRRNFAVAAAACRALLGGLDPVVAVTAAASAAVPGRLHVTEHSPLVVFDGAHNPPGMAALVDALDEVVGDRRLVTVISVLADKDAGAMLALLEPRADALVLTHADNPRALSAEQLRALTTRDDVRLMGGARPAADTLRHGHGPVRVEPDPRRALELARELAGPDGAVLVTGSLHLVGELLSDPGRRVASAR